MVDRIPSGFDPFVLPFLIGMGFVLLYCLYGIIKILFQLSSEDRRSFLVSLITPATAWKNVKDIFLNCLIHVKLWKRNKVLGYMHSSIAFGWFMIILLGHLEVLLFVPRRINLFYYPIFFNYFVAEGHTTLKGALLFFLMDFFLLMILSGIVLAIIKRFRSRIVGMKHTTNPSILDSIGLYALWAIFPLRLLAEGFTAHISGGSFLTVPLNWVARQFLGNELNMLPTWWAYSIVLGVFMCVLPFTRYMHIPAEMMLIPMRNAGLKIRHPRRGFTRVQVFSCPSCGVCIDACPMSVSKANLKDCTVYLNRQIRRRNEKRIEQISDKCLLCGKCEALCQIGLEGPAIRIAQRELRSYALTPDFREVEIKKPETQGAGVVYFAGCMTALTPAISKAVDSLLHKAGIKYFQIDKDEGLCCGRPLMTAGRREQALQLVRKNEELIKGSGADTLLLSCPICYKIFSEQYNLPGIRVVHHSVFFDELIRSGKLKVEKSDIFYAYHDPCDLGRGSGIYEEPRHIVATAAALVEAPKSREESICCAGSLGSITLGFKQRIPMAEECLKNLYEAKPDAIATACPLCYSTLLHNSDRPVKDIAQILDASAKN